MLPGQKCKKLQVFPPHDGYIINSKQAYPPSHHNMMNEALLEYQRMRLELIISLLSVLGKK